VNEVQCGTGTEWRGLIGQQSTEPSDDLIIAKLNGDCLGGCNTVHPPYECPNLVGDVEHQKKTVASLSGRQRFLPV